VDSLGITIKFFADKKLVDESIIGRSQNYNYSNARKSKSKEVYQLQTNIYNMINPMLSSWRNNIIAKVSKDEIKQVNVQSEVNSYSLIATDSLWIYRDAEREFNIPKNNQAIMKAENGMTALRSSTFYDNKFDEWAEFFEKPLVVVDIEKFTGEVLHLVVAENSEKKYAMQKNGDESCLYAQTKNWVDRFTFTADQFEEIPQK